MVELISCPTLKLTSWPFYLLFSFNGYYWDVLIFFFFTVLCFFLAIYLSRDVQILGLYLIQKNWYSKICEYSPAIEYHTDVHKFDCSKAVIPRQIIPRSNLKCQENSTEASSSLSSPSSIAHSDIAGLGPHAKFYNQAFIHVTADGNKIAYHLLLTITTRKRVLCLFLLCFHNVSRT